MPIYPLALVGASGEMLTSGNQNTASQTDAIVASSPCRVYGPSPPKRTLELHSHAIGRNKDSRLVAPSVRLRGAVMVSKRPGHHIRPHIVLGKIADLQFSYLLGLGCKSPTRILLKGSFAKPTPKTPFMHDIAV